MPCIFSPGKGIPKADSHARRFAPEGVTVPKMHDYTPKSRTKDPD